MDAAEPSNTADPALRRLQRLNDLLEAGLAIAPDERAAWLDGLREPDAEVLLRLRALLQRADVETDAFLQGGLDGLLPPATDALGDKAGDVVGPYRLLKRLGQGGMASVWLAERHDAQLQRQVAIKLPLHPWGSGTGLARRMARERNILAALEHPRIARLYEAGVSAAGRPWLAMERVDGQPLDQWCRAQRPELRRLLRLFLQIADAVAYAHTHLVVHRDLKPANVLVDAGGEAHLLDFGIAKLLDDPLEDGDASGNAHGDAQITRQIGRALTPDYAAPEQMGNRPITMACDVYSLGILLFEMLTGERPYRLAADGGAALEAAALAADVPLASTVAQRHDARRAKALRGDLDAIVAKALEKDPRERYASATAMADDLRRHLAGQPVLARTPSLRYRAAKLMRRHRAAVLGGAAAFAALGIGLGLALWQWRVASLERDYTEQLLTRSLAVQQFATRVLTEGVARDERVSLDELLARSESLLAGNAEPVERASGASTLASWYNSYGNYRQADAVLAKAIAQLDPAAEPELRPLMLCQQAHAWSGLGRFADAEQRLLAVARDAATPPASASYCYRILAIRSRNDNQAQAALDYARLALDRLDAARGGARPLDRALILAEQAYAEGLLGRPDHADTHFAQSIEQLARLGLTESLSAVSIHNNRAIAWLNAGRPRQAWPHLERAAAIARRRSPTAELPAYLVYNRANALGALGRGDEALAELAALRGAALDGSLPPVESVGYWVIRFALQAGQDHQDHQAEALQSFEQLTRTAEAARLNAASPGGAAFVNAQARHALMLKQPAQAQSILDPWLQAMQRAGQSNSTLVRALLTRAEALSQQGRHDAALQDLDRAQAAAASANRSPQALTLPAGQVWLARGKLHQASGQPERAREAFDQALLHLHDSVGPAHPQALEAAAALAALR
ncbi:MAG: protein kinase [Proteobacteria bacterium]|nr:protein kinase [Pseudomonadota bacterium]